MTTPKRPDSIVGLSGLEALHQAGWRIVRTDDCADPRAPLGHCGCRDTRITEEWKPRERQTNGRH